MGPVTAEPTVINLQRFQKNNYKNGLNSSYNDYLRYLYPGASEDFYKNSINDENFLPVAELVSNPIFVHGAKLIDENNRCCIEPAINSCSKKISFADAFNNKLSNNIEKNNEDKHDNFTDNDEEIAWDLQTEELQKVFKDFYQLEIKSQQARDILKQVYDSFNSEISDLKEPKKLNQLLDINRYVSVYESLYGPILQPEKIEELEVTDDRGPELIDHLEQLASQSIDSGSEISKLQTLFREKYDIELTAESAQKIYNQTIDKSCDLVSVNNITLFKQTFDQLFLQDKD